MSLQTLDSWALRCGPLIYCLEACDQPTLDLDLVAVDSAEAPQPETLAALPGLTALSLAAWEIEPLDKSLASGMYHPKQIERRAQPLSKRLLAIPYFAWANRAPGAMRVWMKAG